MVDLDAPVKKGDLLNHEKIDGTPRYCPQCDPFALHPYTGPEKQCGCGRVLIVKTQYSGSLVLRVDQYQGSRERYSKPVALVTGNPGFGPSVPMLLVPGQSALVEQSLDVKDDDVPF